MAERRLRVVHGRIREEFLAREQFDTLLEVHILAKGSGYQTPLYRVDHKLGSSQHVIRPEYADRWR